MTLTNKGPWIDELETVSAVLLAILAAHLIGAKNVSWAAFSAYMVIRRHIADSVLRGTLRILGTAVGAGLALLIVPAVHAFWGLSSVVGAIIGGLSLYGALTGRHAYGWLFVGITFEMILLDKLAHPDEAIAGFATTRFLEVVAGTCACIVVSTLSALTARRRWPGTRAPAQQRVGWHSPAAQHAAQGAAALALLPLSGWLLGVQDLAQGAVSIMAAMIVPLGILETKAFASVSLRQAQRIIGGVAGGALSTLALLAANGSPPVLLAATAAGVFIGRNIENSGRSYAYVGTQFTLAVLVTLVPDSYATAPISPALDRLYGILLGTALLEPVLIVWHYTLGTRAHRIAMR